MKFCSVANAAVVNEVLDSVKDFLHSIFPLKILEVNPSDSKVSAVSPVFQGVAAELLQELVIRLVFHSQPLCEDLWKAVSGNGSMRVRGTNIFFFGRRWRKCLWLGSGSTVIENTVFYPNKNSHE